MTQIVAARLYRSSDYEVNYSDMLFLHRWPPPQDRNLVHAISGLNWSHTHTQNCVTLRGDFFFLYLR